MGEKQPKRAGVTMLIIAIGICIGYMIYYAIHSDYRWISVGMVTLVEVGILVRELTRVPPADDSDDPPASDPTAQP